MILTHEERQQQTKVLPQVGQDVENSAVPLYQQRFQQTEFCSAFGCYLQFYNIIGHLFRAGQAINAPPAAIPDR